MAACHRVSNEADSPVLAKFVNLDDRNDWISNAKHLKNSNLNVSLSPDLPPALQPLKTDIMKQRKAVLSEGRVPVKVKYPYISLSVKGKPTITPTISKKTIISKYLGLNQ